jgi:probable phosphoglycerate mutase
VIRRRIYLMRHAEVRYFEGINPRDVVLTERGRAQAEAAREALRGVTFDRVVTSGLPRTVETAAIVAPDVELERWKELREIESGRVESIPEEEREEAFLRAWHGEVPEEQPFLGGETIGELLDRVLPALDTLLADQGWDVVLAVLHGAVNRAILSHALTGRRAFLGGFEQSPGCINVLEVGEGGWIVRAVNHTPYDPAHLNTRLTTMETLWEEYRGAASRRPHE